MTSCQIFSRRNKQIMVWLHLIVSIALAVFGPNRCSWMNICSRVVDCSDESLRHRLESLCPRLDNSCNGTSAVCYMPFCLQHDLIQIQWFFWGFFWEPPSTPRLCNLFNDYINPFMKHSPIALFYKPKAYLKILKFTLRFKRMTKHKLKQRPIIKNTVQMAPLLPLDLCLHTGQTDLKALGSCLFLLRTSWACLDRMVYLESLYF